MAAPPPGAAPQSVPHPLPPPAHARAPTHRSLALTGPPPIFNRLEAPEAQGEYPLAAMLADARTLEEVVVALKEDTSLEAQISGVRRLRMILKEKPQTDDAIWMTDADIDPAMPTIITCLARTDMTFSLLAEVHALLVDTIAPKAPHDRAERSASFMRWEWEIYQLACAALQRRDVCTDASLAACWSGLLYMGAGDVLKFGAPQDLDARFEGLLHLLRFVLPYWHATPFKYALHSLSNVITLLWRRQGTPRLAALVLPECVAYLRDALRQCTRDERPLQDCVYNGFTLVKRMSSAANTEAPAHEVAEAEQLLIDCLASPHAATYLLISSLGYELTYGASQPCRCARDHVLLDALFRMNAGGGPAFEKKRHDAVTRFIFSLIRDEMYACRRQHILATGGVTALLDVMEARIVIAEFLQLPALTVAHLLPGACEGAEDGGSELRDRVAALCCRMLTDENLLRRLRDGMEEDLRMPCSRLIGAAFDDDNSLITL